jgi:lipooligosaccharide transport system permease protein
MITAFRYWMTRYRRVWRGTAVVSLVNPLIFLALSPVMNAAGHDGAYRNATPSPLRTAQILHGHLLFIAFRIVSSNAAFVAVLAVSGVCRTW